MPLGTEPEKEERWGEPGWEDSSPGEQSEMTRETEIKVGARGPEWKSGRGARGRVRTEPNGFWSEGGDRDPEVRGRGTQRVETDLK